MIVDIEAKYYRGKAALLRSAYQNRETAILANDPVTGEPLFTATINLEAYGDHPAEGNVFIKTWSENEGLMEALIKAGVISEPIRTVQAGYCEAAECKLLANVPSNTF